LMCDVAEHRCTSELWRNHVTMDLASRAKCQSCPFVRRGLRVLDSRAARESGSPLLRDKLDHHHKIPSVQTDPKPPIHIDNTELVSGERGWW
jgi:hypothetical protein